MAQQTARKRKKPQDKTTDYEKELAGYLQDRIKPGLNKGAIPLLARSIAKEIASRQSNGASEEPTEQDKPNAEAEDEQDVRADDEPTGDEPEPEAEAEDELADDVEEEPEDEADEDEPEDEADEEPEVEADEDEIEDEPEDEVDEEPEDDVEDEPEDEADDDEARGEADFEADMRDLQAELGDEWVVRFSVKGDEAWLTAEKVDGSQHVEAQTADTLLDAVELLEEGGGRAG